MKKQNSLPEQPTPEMIRHDLLCELEQIVLTTMKMRNRVTGLVRMESPHDLVYLGNTVGQLSKSVQSAATHIMALVKDYKANHPTNGTTKTNS